MKYVGVDVSKPRHCLGAMERTGEIIRKPAFFNQNAKGFAWLKSLLEELGGPSEVVIGMEATGHYWVLLAEELQSWGYQPQVFNPILSCDAGRTTVRGRKTDEDDCLVIAKVLRDGGFSPVSLPTPAQAQLKLLTRYRQRTVSRCANLKKRLIGLLDLVNPEFQRCFRDPSCPAARVVLAAYPSAKLLAQAKATDLVREIQKASHGRLGVDRLKVVIEAAQTSIAVKRESAATEMAIRNTIAEIALLETQIAAYDREIAAIPSPDRELLRTIPGIGPVLAAVIIAEIVSIDRFRRRPGDGHDSGGIQRLLAFAGLDPRISTSGNSTGKTRMSKRGSRALRCAIWRAAFVACKNPAFADIYQKHRKFMKQHQYIALSHVARKMVQAIYGVLRYQRPFDLDAFRGQRAGAA